MGFKRNKVDLLVILLIFLTGFFIRLINLRYCIFVDEFHWVKRGQRFINAIADLKASGTFLAWHPGVTVMYISGLVQWFLPEHLDLITYVRLPFCIFGAATCSLIYLMGKSIFNRERGLIAAVMLTFEPLYIGITRLIQLDGLLSFFFTLTLYFFWLATTRQKQKYVVLSGVSLGLAALTKSPAIFLIPVLIVWLCLLKNNDAELQSQLTVRLLLKIGLIGGIIFVVLWPGIWSIFIGKGAYKIEYLIGKYTEHYHGHENLTFFLGSSANVAPFYFYPVILLIRLSTGVLVCFIISLVVYANKIRKRTFELEETLFLVVIVIFIIGISLIGKKGDRYLITIWPILMIISSGGFQTILLRTGDFFKSIDTFKKKQFIPKEILVFVVVFPAAFWSVNYQPFYVFYFNDFVGGLKGGSQMTAAYSTEGSRIVAEYLSNKSDSLVVACAYFPRELANYYEGHVTRLPESVTVLFEQYDYIVFHLTYVQRFSDNILWQYFKDKTPEFAILVQDVTIIWVFNLK